MFSLRTPDSLPPGVVVCEIPAQPQWCEIRTTVFSWTPTRFPFHTGSAKTLKLGQSPIITVIGKAMWDVGHAPKEQNNRRKYMPDYAVWEIHPVMKLEVIQRSTGKLSLTGSGSRPFDEFDTRRTSGRQDEREFIYETANSNLSAPTGNEKSSQLGPGFFWKLSSHR